MSCELQRERIPVMQHSFGENFGQLIWQRNDFFFTSKRGCGKVLSINSINELLPIINSNRDNYDCLWSAIDNYVQQYSTLLTECINMVINYYKTLMKRFENYIQYCYLLLNFSQSHFQSLGFGLLVTVFPYKGMGSFRR